MPSPNATAIKVSPSSYDFSPMHERMQWYIDQNILSCCATLVLKAGEVVDYTTLGFQDLDSRTPLPTDAIWRMYSNTKLVTSVALMQLFERGLFTLDDPIASHLPAFAEMQVLKADATSTDDIEPAASAITFRQVLSHSAGFSYGFIEPESVIDQAYNAAGLNPLGMTQGTLADTCANLATLPLVYQPGSSWRYSLATDVCAHLVEVLSGQSFDAYLSDHVFQPLNMVDTDFWVPPEKTDRFITMYAPTDILDPMAPGLVKADDPVQGQYNSKPTWLSGGGGLCSTVADYLQFLRMLINGGSLDGQQLLQPDTVRLMRTNALAEGVGVAFPMWAMPHTVFGLGFAIKEQAWENEPASATGEYHWGGMAGTHTWMAPDADLMGFCLTQRMPGYWHPFSHEFRTMVYQQAG